MKVIISLLVFSSLAQAGGLRISRYPYVPSERHKIVELVGDEAAAAFSVMPEVGQRVDGPVMMTSGRIQFIITRETIKATCVQQVTHPPAGSLEPIVFDINCQVKVID